MYVNKKCLTLFLLKRAFKKILYTNIDYNTCHQEPYVTLTSVSFFLKHCSVYHIRHTNTAIKQTNKNKNLFLSLRSCLHKKIAKFHVKHISFETDFHWISSLLRIV